MSAATDVSLRIWQETRDRLMREQADSYKLSLRDRSELLSDLAYAQKRVRYWREKDLEQTRAEINAFKREVA